MSTNPTHPILTSAPTTAAGSSSSSAPMPVPTPTSASTFTAVPSYTPLELARLLQSSAVLSGPGPGPLTSAATATVPALHLPPITLNATSITPLTSLPSTSKSTSAQTPDAILESLAAIYQQPVVNNNSSNSSNRNIIRLPASLLQNLPAPGSGAGTGSTSKKRSRKGKDPADPQQQQQQEGGAGSGGSTAKRQKKATGQGTADGAPRKRGRPRKNPETSSTPAAAKDKGKGKGKAKDSTDPSNSTNPPGDQANNKGGDDSEFETDDDMVEIIFTRIPNGASVQKRKIEALEDQEKNDDMQEVIPGQIPNGANTQKRNAKVLEEQEQNKEFACSSDGEESDHEDYEGHDRLEAQAQADRPSTSKVVRGGTESPSFLPTEVLQQILHYLPLSKIARYARISKAWLDAARVLPVWKDACKKAELGDPKKKYRTHMALVCANSYWICERCMSYSKGREHYADLPLPVSDEEDDYLTWMLCLPCRKEYFERHPEPLREDRVYRDEFTWVVRTKKLAPNAVFLNYALRGENLHGVESTGRPNSRRQLFDRAAIQRRALEVHGGWVGVDACATNPGRKRAAVCNAQSRNNRIYTKKPPTKKRLPVSEEKKAERKEALEQRRTEREEARQENWRQRRFWDRVTRLGKRHKWHTTANWRKSRWY
ncbi:hypothetical protein BGX33_002501 [Mortierella sp. NVP41]|nr:hypothetical protein BGX33_002501 [Mortierella sp. NVP41]